MNTLIAHTRIDIHGEIVKHALKLQPYERLHNPNINYAKLRYRVSVLIAKTGFNSLSAYTSLISKYEPELLTHLQRSLYERVNEFERNRIKQLCTYTTHMRPSDIKKACAQLKQGLSVYIGQHSLHPDMDADCIWGTDSVGMDYMASSNGNAEQAVHKALLYETGESQTINEAMAYRC